MKSIPIMKRGNFILKLEFATIQTNRILSNLSKWKQIDKLHLDFGVFLRISKKRILFILLVLV